MAGAAPEDRDTSLVSRALTSIRRGILNGDNPAGSWLGLHVLAQETGASLILVREALRVLEAERPVESLPNRGVKLQLLDVVTPGSV